MANLPRLLRRAASAAVALALIVAVAGVVRPQDSASADVFFCEDDPVIAFNGVNTSIVLGIVPGGLDHIRGDAQLVVVVPADVSARVVSTTNRYFQDHVVIVRAGDDAFRAGGAAKGDDGASAAESTAGFGNEIVVLARIAARGGDFLTELSAARVSPPSALGITYGTSSHMMRIAFPVPAAD